jgi:hypothetical protein
MEFLTSANNENDVSIKPIYDKKIKLNYKSRTEIKKTPLNPKNIEGRMTIVFGRS